MSPVPEDERLGGVHPLLPAQEDPGQPEFDPPVIEEAGVVHHHAEPLWVELAVDSAELRHVGVDRQLLPRQQQVGEDDRRLDDRTAEDFPGRVAQAFVFEKGLDPGCVDLVAVGVGFAEVVGAGGEGGDVFARAPEPPLDRHTRRF